MNYVQLYQAIQDYAETTEQLFVANIPRFVQEAEDRIYNSVQIPSLRKNVTGTLTSGNKYLSLPNDWLSTYSLAIIKADGNYEYLLNYPPTIVQGQITLIAVTAAGTLYVPGTYENVSLTGGSGSGATATITVNSSGVVSSASLTDGGQFYVAGNTLSATASSLGGAGSGLVITVTGISNATGTSWLGDNYDPVLFYGSMREAMIFQKQEPDVIKNYEEKYQEAMQQLKRLGDGLERGDAYRDGQTKLRVNS